MTPVLKTIVAAASGVSLVLVCGTVLHVISGGNDALAWGGALASGLLAAFSLRIA